MAVSTGPVILNGVLLNGRATKAEEVTNGRRRAESLEVEARTSIGR